MTRSSDVGVSLSRYGVFVDGICYAPINVDLMVENSTILAQTFLREIEIGRGLRGAVVAIGGATTPNPVPPGYADGHIESITVGFQPLEASATPYVDLPAGLSSAILGWQRTLPTPPAQWSEFAEPLDAVIHAAISIGEVNLEAMHSGASSCTKYPPAIEAPLIEVLRIDSFANGTIWSGDIVASDPSAAFAQIDYFNVGCMRQLATVRMKDWTQAIVDGDMFGDIHVTSFPASKVIHIGGTLGNEDAFRDDPNPLAEPDPRACDCAPVTTSDCQQCDWFWNYLNLDTVSARETPRNPWWPVCGPTNLYGPTLNTRGQVWIHNDAGLAGQLIINAENTSATTAALWEGAVHVGENTGGCPKIEISPVASSPWQSPYYNGLSATLDSGAAGLVPFNLHGTDCLPPNGTTGIC